MIPVDQTSETTIRIPDGDPQVELGNVNFSSVVRNSNVPALAYMLITTAQYPDRSVITFTESRSGDDINKTSTSNLTEPVTILVQVAQDDDRRIQITVNRVHYFTVDVPGNSLCFNLNSNQSFTYADSTLIIPSQPPTRYDNIRFLYTVERDRALTYEVSSTATFRGEGCLCVNTRLTEPQAFFTQQSFVCMSILDRYNSIRAMFSPPSFSDNVSTDIVTIVDVRSGAAEVGQNVVVREGNSITLRANLQEEGNPSSEIQWFFNGQPVVSDSNIGISEDGRVLFISRARPVDGGEYQARARNPVGADLSNITRVTVQPDGECILYFTR